jgi:SET domain-containing protein
MRIVPPTKIEIKLSEAKGLGVFATEDIALHEIIETVGVLTIPSYDKEGKPVLHDYRFAFPMGPSPQEHVIGLGYASFYNHSDKPNAMWTNNPIQRGFMFYALRFIKAGEEILVYYGDEKYWANYPHINKV